MYHAAMADKFSADRSLVDLHIERAAGTIRRHLPNAVIYLFGSWAEGTAYPESDIDLAIDIAKEIPILTMYHIREDIERLPTLRRFDIVDLNAVSRELKEAILANGVRVDHNAKKQD